ncbi:MAG: GNAT family N-acetyltransferase [Prevotella sp.]|nr:GNAT family N-acetyltransferase [Prevotella sp.]
MQYSIREIRAEEIPLLDDFLYEAIYIPPGTPAPPRSILQEEALQVYVRDFGQKPDDKCLVAEADGTVVGAVWTRIMHDYGHVDDHTPSLAIALYPDYRGQGIGTALMTRMLEWLRQSGYQQVSLSVQKDNRAVLLYQRVGFQTILDHDSEYLMICRV